MCLRHKSKLKRATKDVVCYKVVFARKLADNPKDQIVYPYYCYFMEDDNRIYNYKLGNKTTDKGAYKELRSDSSYVNYALHSYKYMSEAIKDFKTIYFSDVPLRELRIPNGYKILVECVIPKHSFYVEGRGFGFSGFASTSIIIKKILDYIYVEV